LSKSKTIKGRAKLLGVIFKDEILIGNLTKIKDSFSNNHSFSQRAINEMIPTLLKESINQMQIIMKRYNHTAGKFEFKENQKFIPLL
jgi:hypothetical protein